jgi:hypothetical protein
LEFRPEDEDVRAEDTVLDDEDNREEFVRQADDEEANEDSGSVNSHKPAAVNPMRRGGPGKPRSSLPTWLRANYDDMCERLKREMSTNQSRRPSCYDAGRFIEEPPAPIFCPTNQTQLAPSMFYLPRYFIWLPHLFHRIPCPSCKSASHRTSTGEVIYLRVLSWPRMPRRVIDIDSHTYLIGQRYYCGDLRCKKTYQSWSQSILDALPRSLVSHFPFHLTFRSGLTDQLAALIRSSFGRGLGPAPFAEMIRTFHLRRFEQRHAQYLEMIELRLPYVSSGFLALHEPFGAWDNPDGYAGFVPSHTYFRGFYDCLIERYSGQIDQKMAMNPLRKASLDHSHKVCIPLLCILDQDLLLSAANSLMTTCSKSMVCEYLAPFTSP